MVNTTSKRNKLTIAVMSFIICFIVLYTAQDPLIGKIGLGQTTVTVSTDPTRSLPIGWEIRYTSSGVPFYYDAINDVTSFSPPAQVGYPTVLNTPLFSQANPANFPPISQITNPQLHKWGQYGIGPEAYAPFGSSQVEIVHKFCNIPPSIYFYDSNILLSADFYSCVQVTLSSAISTIGASPGIVMDGGITPLGTTWNTSAAFWAYKYPNSIPLGSTARTSAAYANYKLNNVIIAIVLVTCAGQQML
jgi:hypothetical protein